MNGSGEDTGRDLFVMRQRLLEAEMAREESDRHKDRLRDMAASVFGELRVALERIRVLEAHVRRLERENETLAARLPGDIARFDGVREALVRAQADLVGAHETSNECELLVDSLQLQIVELRAELALARGLGTREDGARA
jgi:hypothetical protein